MPNKKSRKALD